MQYDRIILVQGFCPLKLKLLNFLMDFVLIAVNWSFPEYEFTVATTGLLAKWNTDEVISRWNQCRREIWAVFSG